ncbi:MAG: YggT family protein [Anaerolineales bacterium]|jgi:YggT family protein
MLNVIANIINLVANLFIFIVIADSVLSFFMSPYHPIRVTLGRIINPFLAPIRRIIPLVGMLDLSPLILIILVEILARALISLL